MSRILLILLSCLSMLASAANAETFYVSSKGNDSWPGTQKRPFASLNLTKTQVPPGSTILVEEGIYEGPVQFSATGTAEKPIRISPVSGQTVIFDGTSMVEEKDLILITGNHVIFEGFTVRNAKKSGIILWGTHHVTVRANTVYSCARSGVWVGYNELGVSSENLIEDNTVYDTALINQKRMMPRHWPAAIEVTASNSSVVRGNRVYKNYGEGISVLSSEKVSIEGNLVYDNYSVDIYLDNSPNSRATDNTVGTSRDVAFYRDDKPARGIAIADKEAPFPLPSKNIVITNNRLIGVVDVFVDPEAGTRDGIRSHIIRKNIMQRGKIELN